MQKTGSEKSPAEDVGVGKRVEPAATPPVGARLRARFFQRADKWFNRGVRMMTAIHEGFWLGCLSADELNAVTARHYARSLESASLEGNLRGFFEWEQKAVERHFPRGSRVLVAGAGGGREVLALRRAGYSAEGFECNPGLVEASKAIFDRAGEASGVILCPPDEVPSGPPVYHGIVVGWTAYSHIPTRERRVAFLRALRQRALPGSPILLSFFARSGESRYDALIFRIANCTRGLVGGGKEPVELGDHLSWSYSHWFAREEIESELRDAGIRLVDLDVGEGYAVGAMD